MVKPLESLMYPGVMVDELNCTEFLNEVHNYANLGQIGIVTAGTLEIWEYPEMQFFAAVELGLPEADDWALIHAVTDKIITYGYAHVREANKNS